MTFKHYRAESRLNWGRDDREVNHDEIKLGAILRIADATELMAKNNAALVADLDFWKRRAADEERMRTLAEHRVRSLKGVITKLRRRTSANRELS